MKHIFFNPMIIPERNSLSDIFKSNAILEVPKYQRAFDWGKSEVIEMMSDLKISMNSGAPLFLGAFVFHVPETKIENDVFGNGNDKVDAKKQHEIYKIVDGQQRLTSFMLLLIACRQHAKILNYNPLVQRIQEKISFTDETTGDMIAERLKVSPSIVDVFRDICDENWNGEFPNKIDNKPVKRQSNKLRSLYDFMFSEIKEFSKDDLSQFLKTIYSSYVIEIKINSEQEAFDIFERTNARGLTLNVADLLKNLLYANNSEEFIDEKWLEITRNAGNLLQRMIKYYWVAHYGPISKSELYSKLKEVCASKSAEILTNEIYDFSVYFSAISTCNSENIKEWLNNIGCQKISSNQGYLDRIVSALEGLNHFNITQHIPLVYSVTNSYLRSPQGEPETKLYLKFLENLEKYHFINNQICERVGNDIEKPYAEYSEAYQKTSDFIEITSDFFALLKDKLATEEEFASRFSDIDYLSVSLGDLCYIFDRINNFGLAPSEWLPIFNTDKTLQKKHYNTEHFLSQKPDFVVNEEDMSAVHSIGNLFIISRHTNSKLQNKPPEEKVKLLKDRGKCMRYITDFVEEFEKTDKKWGKVEIDKRTSILIKKAYREIWKLK